MILTWFEGRLAVGGNSQFNSIAMDDPWAFSCISMESAEMGDEAEIRASGWDPVFFTVR